MSTFVQLVTIISLLNFIELSIRQPVASSCNDDNDFVDDCVDTNYYGHDNDYVDYVDDDDDDDDCNNNNNVGIDDDDDNDNCAYNWRAERLNREEYIAVSF